MPFADSRRLTGANLFFATTGAVLEAVDPSVNATLVEAWRARVQRMMSHLGWATAATSGRRGIVARPHAVGTSLAIAAPPDQLFTATEVNEWALCASLADGHSARGRALEQFMLEEQQADAIDLASVVPPVLEERAARSRLAALAAKEAQPTLIALLREAGARGLPCTLDDELLTIGYGRGGHSWPRSSLPAVAAVEWSALHGIPLALVTGSNGKTTTVRLLAACLGEHGLHAGFSCTDGLYVAGNEVEAGDYSGPLGARTLLRNPLVEACVLETARGGILRRGIAVERAQAAVVTNISADHFGEYGIDDLDALADVKLRVATVLGRGGMLVLNADDEVLLRKAASLREILPAGASAGWFALDFEHPALKQHRSQGGPTCGLTDGRLLLDGGRERLDLGAIVDLPLSAGGSARYNVANLAGAALAAVALGVPMAAIAAVFARFGRDAADNPGRLMRFMHNGVSVLVDYAHNPDGLAGVLHVASTLRNGGRLGLTIGHAGNRMDREIEKLAESAAGFRPDCVVVKENERHLRGRPPGEVPRLLHRALVRSGLADSAIRHAASEMAAVRVALEWARPGDVVVLLMHARAARDEALALLAGGGAISDGHARP